MEQILTSVLIIVLINWLVTMWNFSMIQKQLNRMEIDMFLQNKIFDQKI